MAKVISILYFIFLSFLCLAQQEKEKYTTAQTNNVYPAYVIDGDTLPYINLSPVLSTGNRIFKNRKEQQRWERTKYNVKKVYPLAIIAAARLKEYDRILAAIPNEYERNRFMKIEEEKLTKEFGEQLKELTVSQGKVLIKLIDRETGKTTYDVVKKMRGSFSAFMWQSIAVVFSSNLKSEYDADGDDKYIETAIRLIEDGQF